MPRIMDDENLPPVVMPTCKERRILAGQKALVTGASSGIGRAVAIAPVQPVWCEAPTPRPLSPWKYS